jgi:hypothetical protein
MENEAWNRNNRLNSIVTVVFAVISDQSAKMLFIQRNDMIEDLAAATSHPPLGNAMVKGHVEVQDLSPSLLILVAV